jgi:hypothetical protein
MQTHRENNQAMSQPGRRTEVTGVVRLDALDRAAADRSSQLIKGLASASAHGHVEVADAYDEAAARLTLTVTGSLPAVLRLLNGKSPSAERLVEDRADTALVATVDGVGAEKAVAITDHLLNAAKNHPPDDPPLDLQTEHDERERKLRVKVDGSLFATSYLLFLVNLHLTQSRT